jgi:SAM-dependent methyltransferase
MPDLSGSAQRLVAFARDPGPKIARRIEKARVWLSERPPVGWVRFGSLRRVTPIATHHGAYRGTPIDRYYIERFLAQHRDDIRGRVLEIGDRTYTQTFGDGQVSRSDLLHADDTNPDATIVADLSTGEGIPSDAFDCIICVQTLQMIFELDAALEQLHRILKPGGVLLVTTHGISQLDSSAVDRWGEYWRLTARATRRLLAPHFGEGRVTVEAHGNVLAAVSLLEGITVGELKPAELDHHDPIYEVIVTARAVKA